MASDYTYYDPYTGGNVTVPLPKFSAGTPFKRTISQLRGQEEAAKKKSKEDRFAKDLAQYDAESMKYRDDLLRLFGQSADVAQGLAQRGVMAQTQQYLQSRGIASNSELAASIAAASQSRLAGQTLQAKTDFSSKLMQLYQQDRNGFIAGEYDFMRAIEKMSYGAQLDKEVEAFRQQMAADRDRWGLFNQFLGTLGTVAGAVLL